MKRSMKNISLALALVMVFTLFAGCGGKDNGGGGGNAPPALNDTGYVYVPTFESMNIDGVDSVGTTCFAGDKLYFETSVVVGQEEYDPSTGLRGGSVIYSGVPVSGGSTVITQVEGASGTSFVSESTVVMSVGGAAATNAADGVHYRDVYEPRIFALDIASGEVTETAYRPEPIEEDMEGHVYINALFADDEGNVFAVEERYTYSVTFNLPENFDSNTQDPWAYADMSYGENESKLVSMNAEGEMQMNVNINALFPEEENLYLYDSNIVMGDGGVIYVVGNMAIYAITAVGERLGEVPVDGVNTYVDGICILGDGTVAAFLYDYTSDTYNITLKPLDFDEGKMGESIPIPDNVSGYSTVRGDENYDFYWATDSYFFGYDIETGESTNLLSWLGCNVDFSPWQSKPVVFPDGTIVVVSSLYDYNRITDEVIYTNEIATLTRTPASEVTHKQTLTLACVWLDYDLRREVLRFNRENTDYQIDVIDYSQFDTSDDYDAGLRKLRTEIISGNVPDIIFTSGMPMAQFAAKGLLLDLTELIENDPEFGVPGALVEPVIDAMRDSQGRLYQTASTFRISTVLGSPSLVGYDIGWTFDEFYEAYAKMSPDATIFSEYMTQEWVLQEICTWNLDSLINWETGEVHFDSDEFRKMLEFVKLFPAEYDWESEMDIGYDRPYESEESLIAQGRQMLALNQVADLFYFRFTKAAFGGEVTFIGFPTESGNGSAFDVGNGVAISATSSNQDVAWEFVRRFFTEDYQTRFGYGLSTNAKVLEATFEREMEVRYETDPITGEEVEVSQGGMGMGDGEVIEIYALTQAERDQIMELVNTTTNLYTYDYSVYEIILDAATPYLVGARSLEDTISQIQSRVRLYVNEQR